VPLTTADFERIDAHLARHRLGACSICRGTTWEVGEIVAASIAHMPDMQAPPPPSGRLAVTIGPEFMPLVAVVCKTCFHTVHFAWHALRNG
jgi:hypothetical protein